MVFPKTCGWAGGSIVLVCLKFSEPMLIHDNKIFLRAVASFNYCEMEKRFDTISMAQVEDDKEG